MAFLLEQQLLGSTASPSASVPEGGAPACVWWCDLENALSGISAASARRTDREPFTWQRVLCQNGQGSVEKVQNTRAHSMTNETILQFLEQVNAVLCATRIRMYDSSRWRTRHSSAAKAGSSLAQFR
jgi:hypothetical protein